MGVTSYPTTVRNDYAKSRSTNATDTSFPSKIPTVTEPTGAGVSSCSGSHAYIVFFGAGSDTNTFSAKLIGWREVKGLWVPTPLATVSVALSTPVGISGEEVIDTDRFADTITVTTAETIAGYDVCSPANNTIAHLRIDLGGCSKLEVVYDLTGATNANALVSFY